MKRPPPVKRPEDPTRRAGPATVLDDPVISLTAGREAWICGSGGREARIELDPESFAEVAFCHRLADPAPIKRRRRKRQ